MGEGAGRRDGRRILIVVEPFSSLHLDGFRRLFEDSGSGCFCRYWHFEGTKNEWLDRSAHRPEENFAEQRSLGASNDPSARGLVARNADDGALVGWMKLAPCEAMPKLTNLPVYRGLAAPEKTWVVGCFLVHPSARHRGVARSLLGAAEGYVRERGGRAIDGYPRRVTATLHDEQAWQGPERVFLELGYVAIHDVAPYPVYRKVLD